MSIGGPFLLNQQSPELELKEVLKPAVVLGPKPRSSTMEVSTLNS